MKLLSAQDYLRGDDLLYQRNESFNHLEIFRMLQSVYSHYSTIANQLLMPLRLTFAQSEILLLLYQRAPEIVETGELLQITKISPSSLSYTMKKLKQNGYVDFIRMGDQRKKQIRLTPKAFEIQEEITKVFQHLEDMFFFQITAEDRKCVEVVFRKIAKNISSISVKKNSIYDTVLNDPASLSESQK